ncbi:putative mitochondrial outer membrane protein [Trichoderma ghanense]|uniref:Mitochondrial outer membrane protein n=1 Tax=Trichoderma ghanense TaxID=65468 RepID=A0ABY2HDY8_9HYPO
MAGSIFASAAPYHVISYGTLLGTTFFHSFINGIVMFRTVSRPSFSAIQSKLFPIYFGMQTAIPALLALTFPGNALLGIKGGIGGLVDAPNKWSSLVPIATMFVSGLVNLVVLLPATIKTMKDRHGQAKRDGKEWYDKDAQSDEMRALNKKFGMLHGISSLVNLVEFGALVAYGFTLAARIQ